ncbi:uncharacterized protein FFNC_06823 [Fusarium fujikuroi]|nr:uncharacterized protein FFNC_06823 [Fusarium fujikuroi]
MTSVLYPWASLRGTLVTLVQEYDISAVLFKGEQSVGEGAEEDCKSAERAKSFRVVEKYEELESAHLPTSGYKPHSSSSGQTDFRVRDWGLYWSQQPHVARCWAAYPHHHGWGDVQDHGHIWGASQQDDPVNLTSRRARDASISCQVYQLKTTLSPMPTMDFQGIPDHSILLVVVWEGETLLLSRK